MSSYSLSKSSFVKSVQCQKQLYLYKHFFRLKDPVSKEKQAIFNRGTNVGILAQGLFPGGVDVSPENIRKFDESVEKTTNLIKNGCECIYEAAFIEDDVLIALDLLVKKEGKWFAYEVKSSLKISPAYVLDASLQYYVLKKALGEVEDFFLVTINGEYRLGEQLDIHSLFKFTSVKKDVIANLPFIEAKISEAKKTISSETVPAIDIGEHCFKPYKCDFFSTCWKHLPEKSVFNLSGVNITQQVEWFKKGQGMIESMDDTQNLHSNVGLQISSVKNNKKHIDKFEIIRFLQNVHYPIAFFDIEQFSSAVPFLKGTRPYQQIPFLFSVHMLGQNGAINEEHFFAEPGTDPRKDFLNACIEKLKVAGSIVVFDANLECGILNSLANEFPEYKKTINKLVSRIVDLSKPFASYWYFDPVSLGSNSLKNLYSKLFNNNDFENLNIGSGASANYAYIDMLNETDLFKNNEIKEELIRYCKLDTYASMKLFELLKSSV